MGRKWYPSDMTVQIETDKNQFREWIQNQMDNNDFVNHSKKAVIVALNEELTEKQRLYYTMYHIEGLSIPKIAAELGVNISTVSRTLKSANRRMARVMRYATPYLLNQKPQKKNRRTNDGK